MRLDNVVTVEIHKKKRSESGFCLFLSWLLASARDTDPDQNFNSAHTGSYSRSNCSVHEGWTSGYSVSPRTNEQDLMQKFSFGLI